MHWDIVKLRPGFAKTVATMAYISISYWPFACIKAAFRFMPEARDIVSNTSIPAGAASEQPWQRRLSDDGLLEHEEECPVALPVSGTEKSQE